MTPKHVLQERIDNALSHARPNTPEEDADDLELMERLYQEDLKRQSITSGAVAPGQAVAGDADSAALSGSSATTPDI